MRPNKAETAVHGCHYLGQEPIGLLPGWYGCAYVRPWVGVWACHLRLLFEKSYLSCRLCQSFINSHNKNRMIHPLQVAKNCTTHPLPRVQKLMTHPLSAPAQPPYTFDQSLMTQKSCAVEMRNAKLGNHLKVIRQITNWRQFFMRLSCYWLWIWSSHCQSSCGSTRR